MSTDGNGPILIDREAQALQRFLIFVLATSTGALWLVVNYGPFPQIFNVHFPFLVCCFPRAGFHVCISGV